MVYDCLALSNRYLIDYVEIDEYSHDIPTTYDFYAFNYHHVRMSWLDTTTIRRLPGLRLTFVLEILPGNPFVFCPRDDFDLYCALDPTMTISDKRVYAFPRPLEAPASRPVQNEQPVPVIGTFGFATHGKGFDLVVDAVNREFDKAIVRINIPFSPFGHKPRALFPRKEYAEVLSDICRKKAKNGVDVFVTHDYLTKPELIQWCADNTLNCFLYDRNLPGLSATTDQAIVSGRPLAVSANQTFRHIHPYITPYPRQSLHEAIETTVGAVQRMQEDWTPRRFTEKFEQVLNDAGIFTRGPIEHPPAYVHLERKTPPPTAGGRYRRITRQAVLAFDQLRERVHPSAERPTLCKFLLSRAEVRASTAFLKSHGYVSHRLACKDWDLANVLKDIGDGNLLDMGSSDSFLLKNVKLKGVKGNLYGIDLQRPDVQVDGVTYVIGDLARTEFADGAFRNVTCLSVIEYDINFEAFARESSRLLCSGGRLYVTFDYWTPKVIPRLRLFDRPWNILDRKDVQRLIEVCRQCNLALAGDVDWSLRKPVIAPDYHSPDPSLAYTFGMLAFQKQ
jgi:hypothetical protein